MKLKKIASLMLAGIMAVSMLAGCKGESNSNSTPDDNTNTTPAASYASTLYNALSETAQKKITFGADSELDADLTDAVGNMASGTIINIYGGMAAVQDSNAIKASPELDAMEADLGAEGVVHAFDEIEPTVVTDLDESVRMLFVVGSEADISKAVEQVAALIDNEIVDLKIENQAAVQNTLHYSYTGSVSVVTKVLTENHGAGMHFIAVEINRVAKG